MKKFSMGMMLTGLLVMQVGCGEEAVPVNTPTPDPGAMMNRPPAGHDAAKEGADAAKEGADAAKEGADAANEGADAAKEGADAAQDGADAAKEVTP